MKKQFMALVLALVLCLGLAVPVSAAGFSDVPAGHWASEQINRAVADGIVGGYADGSFRPAAPVSYAAFSLMLARAFYPGELAGSSGTGAGEAVMNRHGIWNGTSRASRSGGADLPREDMAQCMYNVLVDKGAAIPSASEYAKAMSSISDYDTVSGNCRRGVLVCYTLGLLGGLGDGSFGPQKSMNRAQAAVVIGRLRDYVQSKGGTAGVVEIPSPPEPKAQPVMDFPEGNNTGYLANGKPISEENVMELLNQLKREFPDGTGWGGGGTPDRVNGGYKDTTPPDNHWYQDGDKTGTAVRLMAACGTSSVYGCGGFASMVSERIFGKTGNPMRILKNPEQARIGDMCQYVSIPTGETLHWNIVAKHTSGGNPDYYLPFDTADGNVIRDGKGYVRWPDDSSNTGTAYGQSRIVIVYTRYQDDYAETEPVPMYPLGLAHERAEAERGAYEQRLQEREETVKNLPEIRCAGCGYLMRKAGTDELDMNGGYTSAICSKCGKYFCYQCLMSDVFDRHKASCKG